MSRTVQVVVLLVALLSVGGGMLLVARDRIGVGGPVYELGQVESGLRQEPSAWLGRTIRLRVMVSWGSLACPSNSTGRCATVFSLTEYPSSGMLNSILQTVVLSDILFLHPEPDPFLTRLRGLPGFGSLIPRPQPVVGGGIYRVKLEVAPSSFQCPRAPCYWAVLPDAASALP
jgi:hypothetical protein